jgi:DNA-3-methyladenine glycosylase I
MNRNIPRCPWANPKNPLYLSYHDHEWGVPTYEEKALFELIVLEGAQAGLSWETVLNKRENYREAFDGFDIHKVAAYGEEKIESLLQNTGIIRNQRKIRSAIRNAKVFIEIQEEFGSFSKFIWAYVDHTPIINHFEHSKEVPTSTPLSDRISKELKRRGMDFVGSTIMYAYMQSIGMVNDHLVGCVCHARDPMNPLKNTFACHSGLDPESTMVSPLSS